MYMHYVMQLCTYVFPGNIWLVRLDSTSFLDLLNKIYLKYFSILHEQGKPNIDLTCSNTYSSKYKFRLISH